MSTVSQIKDACDLEAMGALTSPEFDKLKAHIKDLINTYFAYKFSAGWERGKVVGIGKNQKSASPDYGMFIVEFTSESNVAESS